MSKILRIAIYAAHGEGKGGGYDPGAINIRLGLQEHKISVNLCKYTRDELAGYECEVSVFNLDASMSLLEIIAHANKNKFDVILAPHLNAHTDVAYGTESYYYPGDKRGKLIADCICKELSSALGIPQRSNGIDDGGDKASAYYGFIRQTKATAILLETCFITTDSEARKVDEANEQKSTGQAIARGIVKALGLKQKAVATKPAQPQKWGKWCIGNFNEQTKDRADVKVHLDALRKIGYGVWYE
ncbi:MAG: N-acetylmuramoyl-L-alanine amidase [Oscillospiraceae bacterium]